MAGSYSADLRERVLAAVEAGATPGAAARRFAVGRSTAYRWAREARVEGRRTADRGGITLGADQSCSQFSMRRKRVLWSEQTKEVACDRYE